MKLQITNHKPQTNYKKIINKKTNSKKTKLQKYSKRLRLAARQPVFVLNFEPLRVAIWGLFVICGL